MKWVKEISGLKPLLPDLLCWAGLLLVLAFLGCVWWPLALLGAGACACTLGAALRRKEPPRG